MKIVSIKEMREIDRMAIKELGIPGVVLMENAGQSVVSAMEDFFGLENVHKVTVVCGKGNNGGDGFVVSRYLINQKISVDVYIMGTVSSIVGDAKKNLDILAGLGLNPKVIVSKKDLRELRTSLTHSGIAVDAIFGTGFSGKIRGITEDVVKELNEAGINIVSVDTPSGIDSDTGAVSGEVVQADLTVTMGLPKVGQFLYPARHYVGELYVADIGFPEQVINDVEVKGTLVDNEVLRRFIPWRAPNLHKGAFGRILIIAGSTGMSGAAAMAATSALRAGAGLVYLAIPEHLNPILEAKCTETITIPLPQTEDGSISLKAYTKIMDEIKKVDVVAIGPGMSQHPETQKLVRKVAENANAPLLVDADGINALVGYTKVLKKRKKPTVITPHPGEMARLIESNARDIERNKVEVSRRYASKWGVILVLKGAPTVTSEQDGSFWLNPHVNSGLATAGSGDVLTGLIIGFLAQKTTPLAAAVSGVYIHSLAGEILKEKMGEHSIIAGDLIDAIPSAILKALKE
ncbi:NAD(P)H-hydrate dehydratase [candidate division WOR-3 bacterium]|nr:NAD(P)H-hydrate dehydratase [candidate division WOR-3 bacterium]